jgi:hypothetical protein
MLLLPMLPKQNNSLLWMLLPEHLPPKPPPMLLLPMLPKQNKMPPRHDRPLSELLPKLLLVMPELPYKLVSGLCTPCD